MIIKLMINNKPDLKGFASDKMMGSLMLPCQLFKQSYN